VTPAAFYWLQDPQLPPLQPLPHLAQPPPEPATDVVTPPALLVWAAKVERQRLVSARWQTGQAAGSSARLKARSRSNLRSQAGQRYS
jgi:hypothetical protein